MECWVFFLITEEQKEIEINHHFNIIYGYHVKVQESNNSILLLIVFTFRKPPLTVPIPYFRYVRSFHISFCRYRNIDVVKVWMWRLNKKIAIGNESNGEKYKMRCNLSLDSFSFHWFRSFSLLLMPISRKSMCTTMQRRVNGEIFESG